MILFLLFTFAFIILYLGICSVLDKLGKKSISDWLLSRFLVVYFIYAIIVFIYFNPLFN